MRANGLADLGKLLKTAPATAAPEKRAAQSTQPASTSAAGAIRLNREIPVECWRVIGQVAKAAKRNELLTKILQRMHLTLAAALAGRFDEVFFLVMTRMAGVGRI